MRGAYRWQSARSASRRPAPPPAMLARSVASDASALIGRERYHWAETHVSDAECIGQREERPPPVSLVRAPVHQPETTGLERRELLQRRSDVRAMDKIGRRLEHCQRRPEWVRTRERRDVVAAGGEQVATEERPGARIEDQPALPA